RPCRGARGARAARRESPRMTMTSATHMSLTAIASIIGGELLAGGASAASARPSGYSIDSRTLKSGDLFIAIKGPNHDGHRFLEAAAARGAVAAMVSDSAALSSAPAGLPAIVVADTLRGLQDLA